MAHETLDTMPINSLQRNHWSAATLKVLSSLPSRTTGEKQWVVFGVCMCVCNMV